MLKIIEGTQPQEKPNMELLWLIALQKALIQGDNKKISIAGVKYIIASRATKDRSSMKEIQGRFDSINCILMCMSKLTPREFTRLFPIEKGYNGHKYGCKDYFYTRDYLRKLDMDKVIGGEQKLFDLLWAYWNWNIDEFMVECMDNMEGMAHLRGQPGPMDSLIDDMGLKTYTMSKDPVTGQEYLQNNITGAVTQVKKPIPRYLKVVK